MRLIDIVLNTLNMNLIIKTMILLVLVLARIYTGDNIYVYIAIGVCIDTLMLSRAVYAGERLRNNLSNYIKRYKA